MRNVPSALATHLQAVGCTVAYIVRITLNDGNSPQTAFYFTEHDEDIPFDGNNYLKGYIDAVSAITMAIGSTFTGGELQVILDDSYVSRGLILDGGLEGAKITCMLVNWQNPTGAVIIFEGKPGSCRFPDFNPELASIEVVGKLDENATLITEVYQSSCRADFGDARCKFDLDTVIDTFTVSAIGSSSRQVFQTGLTDADDYWNLGVVRWDTGNNAGLGAEVQVSLNADGEVKLQQRMPFAIQVGDTGTIWPGCDKQLDTCAARWDNAINFRGEPYMAIRSTAITEEEEDKLKEKVTGYIKDPVYL